MNNRDLVIGDMKKSIERLRKSDRQLKLFMAVVLLIVSLATAMVIIGSINSV